MHAHRHLRVLALALVVLALSSTAYGQWLLDGTPVLAEPGAQYAAAILSDGAGGAFIAGTDRRGSANRIFVQRIDAYGRPLWQAGGVLASDAPGYHYDPQLIADGAGGLIVTFSNGDIYVQRIDADGQLRWGPTGKVACSAAGNQQRPHLVSNGEGGAIVAWQDRRSGSNEDIYAQRIDAGGNVLWTVDGEAVCTQAVDQSGFDLVTDGAGGVIAAWYDNRTGVHQVYVQRIAAEGNPVWTPDGIAVNLQTNLQEIYPSIVADGAGGAVVAFQQAGILWAQRMDADGVWLWTDAGIRPTTATVSQSNCSMMPDGTGGFYLAWQQNNGGQYDVAAQRVDATGVPQWVAAAEPIGSGAGNQIKPKLVADGLGGFYAAFEDDRAGISDIRIQRVLPDGAISMAADGMALCLETGDQLDPVVTTDGEGGAIVAWDDVRESASVYDQSAVYAQRVERNGNWGYPAPTIATVRDVPGDQGGQVFLAWDAGRLDNWQDNTVVTYSIWRALDVPARAAQAGKADAGQDLVVETLGDKTLYWQKLKTVEAGFTQTYAEIVPTLFDSTSVSLERHHFRVVAHGATPSLYWSSAPDSCRSVDDLAPAAPQGLLAMPAGADIRLSWSRAAEADTDLSHYAVYRSTLPGFAPTAANFLFTTEDTLAVDADPGVGEFHYLVTAIDIHENEGPASNEARTASLSTVPEELIPRSLALIGNHPNPFNPQTTIAFTVPDERTVSLRVYDMGGRLVAVLLDGEIAPAGRNTAVWRGRDEAGRIVAAGIYFYRLESKGFSQTNRMTLVK